MALYRDEGVVLRTYKLGEADRIVVLFTRGRGKIRAVAKGVRRTRSKFGSRLEPGTIVQLQLYEGRNLDIITQAERVVAFTRLRSDLDLYGRSSVVLEMVDSTVVEAESNPALYKLLTGALNELERSGNPVVVSAFAAKFLALEGVQPRLDSCVRCGSADGLEGIQPAEGGAVCFRCPPTGEPLSNEVREAFSSILDGQVRQVLEGASPGVALELESLVSRLVEQHIERRLKSSVVLHQQLHR